MRFLSIAEIFLCIKMKNRQMAVKYIFLDLYKNDNFFFQVNVFDELEKASNNSGLMSTWDTLQSG